MIFLTQRAIYQEFNIFFSEITKLEKLTHLENVANYINNVAVSKIV